jgi:hypothetical protein
VLKSGVNPRLLSYRSALSSSESAASRQEVLVIINFQAEFDAVVNVLTHVGTAAATAFVLSSKRKNNNNRCARAGCFSEDVITLKKHEMWCRHKILYASLRISIAVARICMAFTPSFFLFYLRKPHFVFNKSSSFFSVIEMAGTSADNERQWK